MLALAACQGDRAQAKPVGARPLTVTATSSPAADISVDSVGVRDGNVLAYAQSGTAYALLATGDVAKTLTVQPAGDSLIVVRESPATDTLRPRLQSIWMVSKQGGPPTLAFRIDTATVVRRARENARRVWGHDLAPADLAEFIRDNGWLSPQAISPDGRYLYLQGNDGSYGGRVHVVDRASGLEYRTQWGQNFVGVLDTGSHAGDILVEEYDERFRPCVGNEAHCVRMFRLSADGRTRRDANVPEFHFERPMVRPYIITAAHARQLATVNLPRPIEAIAAAPATQRRPAIRWYQCDHQPVMDARGNMGFTSLAVTVVEQGPRMGRIAVGQPGGSNVRRGTYMDVGVDVLAVTFEPTGETMQIELGACTHLRDTF